MTALSDCFGLVVYFGEDGPIYASYVNRRIGGYRDVAIIVDGFKAGFAVEGSAAGFRIDGLQTDSLVRGYYWPGLHFL